MAERIQYWFARFDRWQQTRPGLSFWVAVMKKYVEDEAYQRASLLTYYAFLALFPLLLVLATALRLLLQHSTQLSDQLIAGATNYFPAIGPVLQANVHTLKGTGPAIIVGVILALVGARGVADTLRSSLDHVWHVPMIRRSKLPAALGRSAAIIIVGGLGLFLTPAVLGYTLAFVPNRLFGFLSALLTVVILFWVLVFIIKIGTSVHQPFRRIWLGAALAMIGLAILQAGGGLLMTRELHRLDALYGTFALVLGLIFWLYLQAQVLMLAFEVDAVRAFKLWPRAIDKPLTPADHAAHELYVDRARFHEG